MEIKRKVRMFSLVLALMLMLTSMLTSCVISSKETDKRTTVGTDKETKGEEPRVVDNKWDGKFRIAGWYDTIRWATFYGKGSYDEMAEAHKRTYDHQTSIAEKYGLDFEAVVVPMGEYLDKITAAAMSGDIFAEYVRVEAKWVPLLVNNDLIIPLNKYMIIDDKKWDSEFIETMNFDGDIYALCPRSNLSMAGISTFSDICFMNRKLVNEAGYSDTEIQNLALEGKWTWDKMVEIGRKVAKDLDGDGEMDIHGFAIRNIDAIPTMNGAPYIKEVNGKMMSQITQPEFIESLQLVVDAGKEGILSSDINAIEPFKEGKVAFFLASGWLMGDLKSALDTDIGILPLPKMPKATRYYDNTTVPDSGGVVLKTIPEENRKMLVEIIESIDTGMVANMDENVRNNFIKETREKWITTNVSKKEDLLIAEMMAAKYPSGINIALFPEDGANGRLTVEAIYPVLGGEMSAKESLEAFNPIYQASIDKLFGQK